ncbi:MAG: FAD-dependent oxidoreductase, partial [Bacillota bacterium]|nr:FAD-dependent oxidoreductase [Bacillota bacterium]
MGSAYDVIIVGAGASGVFTAYELIKTRPSAKVLILEKGHALDKRKCPIDGKKIKTCLSCSICSIVNGFGGSGSMSDGKYNITNQFGGDLYKYVGEKEALDLMHYVDN